MNPDAAANVPGTVLEHEMVLSWARRISKVTNLIFDTEAAGLITEATGLMRAQVQVQREAAPAGSTPGPAPAATGAAAPAAAPPANFFALPPPGAPMYASMDPTAMGTRGQNPNMALGKRPVSGGPGTPEGTPVNS